MKRLARFVLSVALALAVLSAGAALACAGTPSGEGRDGGCRDGKCRGGGLDESAFRVYSMMTGNTVDELKKACEDAGLTVWKLAGKDGKLIALKERMLAGHAAGLDAMVKSGVMSDGQRLKILGRLKEELDKR